MWNKLQFDQGRSPYTYRLYVHMHYAGLLRRNSKKQMAAADHFCIRKDILNDFLGFKTNMLEALHPKSMASEKPRLMHNALKQ